MASARITTTRAVKPALRRIVGRGTYLDDDDIDALLRLAFPGVDELIGLIELQRLAAAGPWDHVVVDTAPTGHTLRLLAMPATLSRIAVVLDDMQAKHRFLSQSLGGRYRPDAADALVEEIAAAGRDLDALLRDRVRMRVSWVLLPEALSLAEARDGVGALEASGIGGHDEHVGGGRGGNGGGDRARRLADAALAREEMEGRLGSRSPLRGLSPRRGGRPPRSTGWLRCP